MDAFAPCPAPFNLAAHVLGASAARLPDKIALQVLRPSGAERWSYARLEAAVRGCGTGLLAMGLQPGDRVLMRLGNGVAFPVLFLGAIAAGLVPVPTSAALTGAEITALAQRIAPALVVADAGVALPEGLACPVVAAAEVLAMEALPPCAYAMGDPDRLAYVVFTSGTSGRPLPVAHAHRAIWARQMMHQGWEGLAEGDRLLHAGAMNWTYTLGTGLLDPWTVGATALVPAAGVGSEALALLLKRFDATIFAAVPGVLRQMLKGPVPALPRLRHALVAGETMPDALRQAWMAATGTGVHEALGMSECSTFVSGSPQRPAPAGCVGYAQPGRRVTVLDAVDGAGVLAVHRDDPGLMLGYLDAPEATAARFRGDWFVTGDVVRMGADGAISYLGRNDDMMNAGGFRVSPLEVEAAMAGLAEVAVTEVELRPGVRVIAGFYAADIAEAVLDAHARDRLARWKQPRLWVRLDALPRAGNMKLNRRALKALFAERANRDPA